MKLIGILLACGAMSSHAADIGGYFHQALRRESQVQCAQWIAEARRPAAAELQYRVGLCYWNGWGVPEDRVAAEAWLRKAAERGHHDAQLSLGDLLRLEDLGEAFRWYAIAAEANHPGAQLRRERAGALLEPEVRGAIRREAQAWRPRAD